MRIRSTKPEFWRSKTIAQLEWEDRFVLKGIESYVDDNGVGKDDLALIASDVFPRDLSASPSRTLARLSEAISRIHKAGLIARYVADGEELVYVDKWRDIQRIDKPGKGRFPRPDGTMEYAEAVNRDSYRNTRETVASLPETLAPVTGEQGNRGTGEQDDDARPEPPHDPGAEPSESVVVDAPELIETPNRPSRAHPSSAAKSVVRQELGNAGYPRAALDRLAVQVGKLAHAGHPDGVIRESLREWDKRPNCDRPEYLETVLGDVVKRARAAPPGISGHDAKVNDFLAFANQPTGPREIEA